MRIFTFKGIMQNYPESTLFFTLNTDVYFKCWYGRENQYEIILDKKAYKVTEEQFNKLLKEIGQYGEYMSLKDE